MISCQLRGGGVIYNGKEQHPVWNNYDPEKLEIGGQISGINAGTYVATFTPKGDFRWGDGTADAKSVNWVIEKAPGSFVFRVPSIDITAQNLTDKLPIVKKGDGAIRIAWFDDLMIDATVDSDTEIIISAVRCGTTSIAVYIDEGTNYTASPLLVYDKISINYVDPVLANNSPQIIQMAARTGQAPNFWSIGDGKSIKIEGPAGAGYTYNITNTSLLAKIIDFNHNSEIEGNNTIHFSIGYSNKYAVICEYNFKINEVGTTAGGWEASYMRNTFCANFLAALPQDWQDIIIPCPKYRDNVGGTESNGIERMSILNDKIWVPSWTEFNGTYDDRDPEKTLNKVYDCFKNGSFGFIGTSGSSVSNNAIASSTPVYLSADRFHSPHVGVGNTNVVAHTYSCGFLPCWAVG